MLRSTGGEDPGIELAYYADNTLLHADEMTDEWLLNACRLLNEWAMRKLSKVNADDR